MNFKNPLLNPFVLLVVVSGLLSSCAFREDDVEEERKKAVEQVTETLKKQMQESDINESNVRYTVKPNPEVGKYDIEITWPADIPKVSIRVNEGLEIHPKGNIYKETFESNERFDFYMAALGYQGNSYDSYSFSIITPNDLIISDKYFVIDEPVVSYSRIKILKNGTLYTDFKDLTIVTDYLEVEEKQLGYHEGILVHSHISTFDRIPVSSDKFRRISSTITINAKKIVGHLYINSIGIDGTPGEDADTTPLPHNSSLDGQDAKYNTKVIEERPPRVRREQPNSWSVQKSCRAEMISQPEAGKNGSDGIAGGAGVQGGDAPKFEINVEDYSDFKVFIVSRPGKGGLGGQGGPGGPGGTGGYYLNHNDQCISSRSNKKANDGSPGQQGPRGTTGEPGSVLGLSGNFPANLMQSSVYIPQ